MRHVIKIFYIKGRRPEGIPCLCVCKWMEFFEYSFNLIFLFIFLVPIICASFSHLLLSIKLSSIHWTFFAANNSFSSWNYKLFHLNNIMLKRLEMENCPWHNIMCNETYRALKRIDCAFYYFSLRNTTGFFFNE